MRHHQIRNRSVRKPNKCFQEEEVEMVCTCHSWEPTIFLLPPNKAKRRRGRQRGKMCGQGH